MAKRPITPDSLYDLKFVEDAQISPDGRWVAFVRVDVDKPGNAYQRHIWLAPAEGKDPPRQWTFGAKADSTPRWRPDGSGLAFVSARSGKPQVYWLPLSGGEARPLTSAPNGATQPVWSPDGRRLAYLAGVNAAERAAEDSGKPEPPPADALEARHREERKSEDEKRKSDPRVITDLPYRTGTQYYDDRKDQIYVVPVSASGEPGKAVRQTEGTVARVRAGRTHQVEVGYSHIAWAADGRSLITVQSAQPDTDPWFFQRIVRVPVTATARRRAPQLITRRDGFEYFDPQPSPDGRWIAAVRAPDDDTWGRRQNLVLIPIRGGAERLLAEELDRAPGGLTWSADSQAVYFLAEDHGRLGLHRVSVRARTARAEIVVAGERMLTSFSLAQDKSVAFTALTPERVGDVYVANARGGRERRLSDFNAAWLAAHALATFEERWHESADGRKIQGWLVRPPGIGKGRRTPLVVSMHGGPWVMWGPSTPAMWLEWQVQAAHGYSVYFCNPRGSVGYGDEHSAILRNNWPSAMEDILSGVDSVVAAGGIDPARLALTGGSYAGYMTAWIVAHDHRFACAWAQRGLYNLISFYGVSDIPQIVEHEYQTRGFEDIERLWQNSPLAHVQKIRTPLAIEHQDADWRCPPSEAEQLYTALKRLGRDTLFIRYPREGHEMSRSGEPAHRVDRLTRMLGWFDTYCKKARVYGR